MIICKQGVQFTKFRTETLKLMTVADACYKAFGCTCRITCGTDGHSLTDPHTNGYAIDMGTHELPEEKKQPILKAIQEAAGPDYYIFLEAQGTDNEHFHGQTRIGLWQERMKAEDGL